MGGHTTFPFHSVVAVTLCSSCFISVYVDLVSFLIMSYNLEFVGCSPPTPKAYSRLVNKKNQVRKNLSEVCKMRVPPCLAIVRVKHSQLLLSTYCVQTIKGFSGLVFLRWPTFPFH
jgi:hypothetical protein